jgi:hypothetical protein
MRILGIAQAPQNERFERHRPSEAPRLTKRLGEEHWSKVRHADQDPRVATAFAALADAAAAMAARSPRSLGLNVKRRVVLESDERQFFKLVRDTAPLLQVEPPHVYERADLVWPRLLAVRDGDESRAALVVGPTLLDGRPATELSFDAVKCLAYLRPEHRMVWTVPVLAAQQALLSAAVQLVTGSAKTSAGSAKASTGSAKASTGSAKTSAGNTNNEDRLLAQLRHRLPPDSLRAIESIPDLPSLPDADLAAYASAVDMTCSRVATMLCGDLETAARVVANEPPTAGGRSARDRVRELVAFYVSQEHYASRDHLGLAIP